MELDAPDVDRFESVRTSLRASSCRCGGFRKVLRRFKTRDQAVTAHEILLGDHADLIDPLAVHDGDEYSLPVEQFEALCNGEAKRTHLKLFRARLTFDTPSQNVSALSSSSSSLPLDPYYLGFWLGDGTALNTGISSSDREVAVYLRSYVHRLNSSRPPGARPLILHESLITSAGAPTGGSYNGKVYHRSVDVFHYRISCPAQTDLGFHWNPVLDGLKSLGLFGNKAAGIPKAYMEADKEVRLAVIAGLMESDGCYVKSHNSYRFIQMGKDHKKIVHDLKALSLSCGISVTGVDEELPHLATFNSLNTKYIIYLGKGSALFQHHLLVARKRMDFSKAYYTHDARPFSITDESDSESRAIEVSGGQFQLENRLITSNCHLVSYFLCGELKNSSGRTFTYSRPDGSFSSGCGFFAPSQRF